MAASLGSNYCANHPDRPGRALCMKCRKTVCQECATQWDGINYCVSCLKERSEKKSTGDGRGAWVWMSLAVAALFIVVCYLYVWAGTIWTRFA